MSSFSSSFFASKKGIFYTLFFVTLAMILLRFTYWGFLDDDFGVLNFANITCWNDFAELFYKRVGAAILAVDNLPPAYSLFGVYWRPLAYITFIPLYAVFGTAPYGYFVVCIAFHALLVGFLGYALSFLLEPLDAYLVGFFWGTHTAFAQWLGWITGLQSQQSALLIALSAFYFYQFLITRKNTYLAGSVLSFITTTFMRETGLVLPIAFSAVAFLLAWCVQRRSFLISLRYSLEKTWLYWAHLVLYIMIRYYIFSSYAATTQYFSVSLFSERLTIRAFNLLTYVTDLLDLAWMGSGNRLVKGSLLLFSALIIMYGFIKSKYKVEIVMIVGTILVLSWPSILVNHITRYAAELVPFMAVLSVLIAKSYTSFFSHRSLTTLYRVVFVGVIFFHVHWMFKRMDATRQSACMNTVAVRELVNNAHLKTADAIMFIGIPQYVLKEWPQWPYFLSLRGAFNLFWGREAVVYADAGTDIHCEKTSQESRIDIQINENRLHFISHSPEAYLLKDTPFGEAAFSMGQRIVHRHEGEKLYEVEFILDEKWFVPSITFMGWDYGTNTFKLLGTTRRYVGGSHEH